MVQSCQAGSRGHLSIFQTMAGKRVRRNKTESLRLNGSAQSDSRYSRQILFSEIGAAGQQKISAATVAVVGLGALGSASGNALARAGIGRLILIDRDVLEWSNLQRQILYTEEDVQQALPKAVAAQRRLSAINSAIVVEAHAAELHAGSIHSLLAKTQVVIDATDNFETRFLINDFCVQQEIPWVYGSCVGSYGMSLTILPGRTPCFRCLVQELPEPGSTPGCDTVGLISSISAIISAVQVAEALKIVVGALEAVRPTLLFADLWHSSFQEIDLRKNWVKERCPVCCGTRFEYLNGAAVSAAVSLCGRNAVHVRPARSPTLGLNAIARRLPAAGVKLRNEYLLKFGEGDLEMTLFADGRAIISGTSDAGKARSFYARFVGL